jgi:hypothetical protein
MVQVTRHDIQLLNELIKSGDKSRDGLMSTLVTVYGAVSSGLFLLATSASPAKLASTKSEKVLFIVVSLSAVLIVFLSLTGKIFVYFANIEVGKEHSKRISEPQTRDAYALSPKRITGFFLTAIPWSLLTLLTINVIGIASHIVIRVIK